MAVVQGLLIGAVATTAGAQPVANFSWQMQPYCNVLTLALNGTPAGFTLDGTDDQCGATNKASAVGIASFNGGGNVTINLTIVLAPSGKAVHVSAVVNPVNGHGTWTDSVGNQGTFAFFGVAPGLPPRPFPASGLGARSVTSLEISSNAVTGVNVVDGSLTSADMRDVPRAAFAGGAQRIFKNTSDDVVLRTVTLPIPAAGRVIVNGGLHILPGNPVLFDAGWCALTTGTSAGGTVIENGFVQEFGEESTPSSQMRIPVGLTRGFDVVAGTFSVNLVCRINLGAGTFANSSITAMYFPQ